MPFNNLATKHLRCLYFRKFLVVEPKLNICLPKPGFGVTAVQMCCILVREKGMESVNRRSNLWRTLYLLLAALFVLFATTAVLANGRTTAVYTVNTTADEDDGTCTQSHCSLREAIQAANLLSDSNAIIQFKVGDLNPVVIVPTSPLPAVTTSILLKTNLYNSIDVVLDGSAAGQADGLTLAADNITLRDLTIQNFAGSGVLVSGSNSLVERNIISNNGGSEDASYNF